MSFTHRGERHYSAAGGIFGGGPGARARSVIHRRDGTVEEIPSKIVTRLNRGDRVVIETAGGGGYGPPARRSDAARAEDRDAQRVVVHDRYHRRHDAARSPAGAAARERLERTRRLARVRERARELARATR